MPVSWALRDVRCDVRVAMMMLGQLLSGALFLARNPSAELGDARDDDQPPPQECQPLDGLHQHQPQVHIR